MIIILEQFLRSYIILHFGPWLIRYKYCRAFGALAYCVLCAVSRAAFAGVLEWLFVFRCYISTFVRSLTEQAGLSPVC